MILEPQIKRFYIPQDLATPRHRPLSAMFLNWQWNGGYWTTPNGSRYEIVTDVAIGTVQVPIRVECSDLMYNGAAFHELEKAILTYCTITYAKLVILIRDIKIVDADLEVIRHRLESFVGRCLQA